MALILAAPAAAQEAPAAQAEINAVIDQAFARQLEPIAGQNCADHDADCLSEELIARYRVDQWAREQFSKNALCADFAGEQAELCFGMVMGATVFKVDLPNTMRLKEIMDLHGWPKPPSFSEDAQTAAWYIAQHAQIIDEAGTSQWDVALAESILPEVREAVAANQLTPWHYAAMFDRIAREKGKPQRYATQIMCSGGRADFDELEDAERVTEFRAEIGMDAFDPSYYDSYCANSKIPGEA
jgi:hypothetical protein